jgi:proline iminopeptidase
MVGAMAKVDDFQFRLLPRELNTAELVALGLIVCLGGFALAAATRDPPVAPDGSRMILVAGGAFAMGDVFSEGEDDEQPVHQVTVAPFYLADAEVSVGQFRRFVRETGYRTSAEGPLNRAAQDSLIRIGMNPEQPREVRTSAYDAALGFSGCAWWDPDRRGFDFDEYLNWANLRFEQTDVHPAVCLSWEDAASYANWISGLDGLPPAYDVDSGMLLDAEGNATTDVTRVTGYRLPTEAEWEYAAREGGRVVRFGNGRDIASGGDAVFDAAVGDYAYLERGRQRRGTSPIRSHAPNAFGLFDMAGNAWEWVSDFLAPYPQDSQLNPYQTVGRGRAVRGGRWGGDAFELRTAKRFQWQANNRCDASGFRLARSGPLTETQAVPGTQPVDTSYYVTLGGVSQYVEIRGASSYLPVLLYLHGGPCMPATPMLRYHQAELSESFVVVSWDQRGCGRSADIDPRPGDMTLERHVLDAHELTTHLKQALRKRRILLVGHSWGSVLGVELAQRYPDDYVAYVGVGQMVNAKEGERVARDTLVSRARARGDTATVRAVENNRYSPQEGYVDSLQGFLAHRRLLWMNGMMDHDRNAMLQAIAAADGYSTDVTEWMQAALYAQRSLFRELMAVDFTQRTAFEIPVFFFAGQHDFNTPSQLVADYAEHVDAPAKRVIWFEESGHSPPWEEPEAFRARLAEVYEVVVGLGKKQR